MSHHSLTFFNSEFISSSNDFRSLADANKLVSSANILKERTSEELGRSLMYIKNSKGPCQRASLRDTADHGLIGRLGIAQGDVLLPVCQITFKPGQR